MPPITRRDFLKASAAGAAVVVLTGCGETQPRNVRIEPYHTPPEEQPTGVASWYATTCRMCPAGCGQIVRIMNGRAVKLEGNPEHPLNRGKLCARGHAGLQLLYNPDRLQGPVSQAQRGGKQWQTLKWEDALGTLANKVQGAGKGVAVWLGSTSSGHLYDLFSKFTSAVGAGAPLVFDLYTGLLGYHSQASAVNDLYGIAALPAYDLTTADVVLSFGYNVLGASENQTRYNYDYGSFRSQGLGKRGLLIQLEPRLSMTGTKADKWFAIRPGSEALIAQAIARVMADENIGGAERVGRAKQLAGQVDVNQAAAAAGLTVDRFRNLVRAFANAAHPIALPGDRLMGQDRAQDAFAAIHALNVIAGNVAQPGGPVMQAPAPAGMSKAVPGSFADARGLVDKMRTGQIQVLLVHGANPAYDLPPAFGFADALKNVPFVASFAPIVDETAALADLIIPDRTYLEAWGYDVVMPNFGTPVVGSQQPVVGPVFDSRATGDVLLDLAQKIPATAAQLPWKDEVAFIKETVAKLPPGASGGSGPEVLSSRFQQHGGWWPATPPPPTVAQIKLTAAPNVPPVTFQGDEKEFPFFLHLFLSDLLSDGRGANLPWLQGAPDPMTTMSHQTWIELHPNTAKRLGLQDGDVVQVTSPKGSIEALVYQIPTIREDTVAIPFGQGHGEYGRYAQNRGSNAMGLVGGEVSANGNVGWTTLRVKLNKTGRHATLARFENAEGTRSGFLNADFPG